MNQGKLDVIKQETATVNTDILGISELKRVQTIQHHSIPSLCPNHWCWRRWSWTILWRPTRPPRTNTKKRCPFHHREWSDWNSLSRVRLCNPMDCSLPGSSVHGILQARILEWVAISFSSIIIGNWNAKEGSRKISGMTGKFGFEVQNKAG